MDAFPIVDISRPNRSCASHVDSICQDTGFLAVTGHGVSKALIQETWETTRAFFDLPLGDKLSVAMPFAGYPYGYSPMEGETLAQSLGEPTPPDLKETLSIGPQRTWSGGAWDPVKGFISAPTLWPANPPSLRPIWQRYFREMGALAGRLLSLFALALDLPSDYFDTSIDAHASALRALNYPALEQPLLPGQLRAGAHTDYGSVTILLTEQDSLGLQIRGPEGTWQAVPSIPGAFVVNIGDLMARWVNDRWVSTLHRVVADPETSNRRRQSIAFFHMPNWDARITCIPTCLAPDATPKYGPVEAGAHLMEKFRSTVRLTDS